MASTLPWPIADEPTARSSPISSAAGIVERAAPSGPGSWLKPKRSAVSTSRFGPELGAERREDGVAGVREGLPQRAAAGLAVGVLELDALERGLGLDRELGPRLDHLRLERARERDDLERRAGRLGSGERDAREPEHLAAWRAAARRCRRSGPRAPRPRRAGCRGRSRSARRRRRAARRGRRRARRRAGCRPGVPDRRSSNSRSSPLSPTGAPSGTPRRASSSARSGGAGPDAPGDLGRQRPEVREPVRALGQRRAVARQDRAARGQRRRRAAAARRRAGRGTRAASASRRPRRPPPRSSAGARSLTAARRSSSAGGPAGRRSSSSARRGVPARTLESVTVSAA